MADLHYTRDEVARLRDEATPGPWRGDRNDGSVKYAIRGSDGRLVLTCDHKNGRYGFVVGDEWSDDEVGGEHDGDERLTLASPTLASDLLTLHAENADLHARVAALTEHAERVGAVLRALADFVERPDGRRTRLIDAIDAATGRYAETWGDLPDIVRALAEVPR